MANATPAQSGKNQTENKTEDTSPKVDSKSNPRVGEPVPKGKKTTINGAKRVDH